MLQKFSIIFSDESKLLRSSVFSLVSPILCQQSCSVLESLSLSIRPSVLLKNSYLEFFITLQAQ